MRIYLAGENGKKKIIPVIAGGAEYLCRYLRIENISCEGVSGNLKPAWKKMAQAEITPKGFIKGLEDANFWRGGSQDIGYKMDWFRL